MKCLRLGMTVLIGALLFSLLPEPGTTGLAAAEQSELVVATRQVAPFAMKNQEGQWRGLTVELWEEIARRRGWSFRFVERSIVETLQGLQSGELDVEAAALTITAERERLIDFSHPFYVTGLGIAVVDQPSASGMAVLRGLFSLGFLQVLGALALLLLVWGFLLWLCERKRNANQFGGSAVQGIASGFWWSAVTMTTVGYGDKAPVTLLGRLVALVWMFAGIIMISGITAAITSTLTVASLQTGITGPEDLAKVRVATVSGTTSENYARARELRLRTYSELRLALQALLDQEVDAVVYDAPIMSYLISREFSGELRTLGHEFNHQKYGMGLVEGSTLREEINRSLLEITASPLWTEIKGRYLTE